ncbi:MAG: four-carbon acid sugar kinase family protein [Vulcanococcus sp.]
MAERLKVVVLDDDPTGSQTVHSAPLLLRWDADTLAAGLAHPSPLLFLLANTRALAPDQARARVAEICAALGPALAAAKAAGDLDRWLIVSRGDSTLRGHFPLEVEQIAAALGPFHATLLVPAFLPGGRTTVDGVHLLHGEPVHTTAFAADRLFGFSTSHLPAWVEQKSGGRIPAAAVQHITLAELDAAAAGAAGLAALCNRLVGFSGNPVVAVDAERPEQLAALGEAVRAVGAAAADGPWGGPRRFLFQSAASLLSGLVPLPPQPLDGAGLAGLRRPLPGLVLVGSHVPLADVQLEALLQEPGCAGLELPVAKLARVLEGPEPEALLASLEAAWLERLRALLAAGTTPVLFTSRGEIHCRTAAERRRLGLELAGVMARLAAALEPQLGYLISKGGITSHTLLADGLGLGAVHLQGQLFAGLSLVLTPSGLPVVTFPGNLGEAGSLRQAWRLLEQG